MKIFITGLVFGLVSTSAFAGVDMGQFEKLHGRSGIGTNPYENTSFSCSVVVDRGNNTLSIVQPDAYISTASVSGDHIIQQSNSAGSVILNTEAVNPEQSGRCGDFLRAKSVKDTLKISQNSVEISTSYRCGFVSHQDTTTCKLK
jgi:hypothetical protein